MRPAEELRYLILAIQREGNRLFASELRPLGVTPSQAEVLRVLNDHGPLTLTALATCWSARPATAQAGWWTASWHIALSSETSTRPTAGTSPWSSPRRAKESTDASPRWSSASTPPSMPTSQTNRSTRPSAHSDRLPAPSPQATRQHVAATSAPTPSHRPSHRQEPHDEHPARRPGSCRDTPRCAAPPARPARTTPAWERQPENSRQRRGVTHHADEHIRSSAT